MDEARGTWQERLEFLRQQEAICSDPAQRFTLKKQIEEAEAKLAELGSCVEASAPALDCAGDHLIKSGPPPRPGEPESDAIGADPWSRFVANTPLWPDPAAPFCGEFRTAALKLAQVCWTQHRAARSVLPEDPWVDESLPTRTLAQLRDLTSGLEGLRLNPAEAALLCLAPLVREAVFARASEHMAACDPLGLDDTGSGGRLRAALEKVHGAHPRLLRKARRLRAAGERAAADQVALWLMHRTLLREPAIWLPPDPHKGLLDGPVLDAMGSLSPANGLVQAALDPTRLLELARCGHYTPSQIDRRDRTGALEDQAHCADGLGDRLVIRERLLAYLLLVAGTMALDPRVLSEVLVEHVGVSHTPPLPDLTAQIAKARWQGEHPTRSLKAVCTHPAVDCALAEQVAHANTLLVAAHRAAEHRDCAPLAGLPSRLDAADIRPDDTGSGPAYRTPHLRFRLAQDQVLELLMGESLYGDPALAIRELYQNALDACRYAQARLTYLKRAHNRDALDRWTGRIRFHQGIDARGRAFIECEDNGIGMGLHELTDTFTQAGRRFADTPEFLDEKSEWLAQDVHLWPNSQFGIGVLSYFMLADDFEVETCRMDRQGRPGEALTATISGSGSLIRVRGGTREMAGTRIRLWLKDRPAQAPAAKPHDTRIRTSRSSSGRMASADRNPAATPEEPDYVLSTLERLLWVAEYATEASHGERTLSWTPGQLGHDENQAIRTVTCATADPNFWWRASDGYKWPQEKIGVKYVDRYEKGTGFILCDGLLTLTDRPAWLCIANLCGERKPRLTADRKEALTWQSDWLATTAVEQVERLMHWDALCLTTVVQLMGPYPLAAQRLWNLICEREQTLPIEHRAWRIPKAFQSNENRNKPQGPVLEQGVRPCAGCIAMDLRFYSSVFSEQPGALATIAQRALRASYECYGSTWALPRLKALIEATAFPASHLLIEILSEISAIRPRPDDQPLFTGSFNIGEWETDSCLQRREVSVTRILDIAFKQKRAAADVAHRALSLGFMIPTPGPADWNLIGLPDEAEINLIRYIDDRLSFRQDRRIRFGDVLQAAARLGRSPGALSTRLATFGLPVVNEPPEWNLCGAVSADDLTLISLHWEGQWISQEVPIAHILEVALKRNAGPAAIAARLREIGFTILQEPDWNAVEPICKEDVSICRPWPYSERSSQQAASVSRILHTAAQLATSPAAVAARLMQFGYAVTDDAPDWGCYGKLTWDDFSIIPMGLGGEGPWLEREIPPGHILRAAASLSRPATQIVARLRELGFSGIDRSIDWNSIPPLHKSDERLIPWDLFGEGPWFERSVPTNFILRLVKPAGSSPAELVNRLRELGFKLPVAQPDWEAIGVITDADRILLPPDPNGGGPWVELAVPPFHIIKAALDLGRPPVEIVKRLQQLGFLVPGTDPEWDAIAPLDDSDRILISRDLDGKGNWIGPETTPARILGAAIKLNRSPGAVAARLLELGFTFPGQQPNYAAITDADLPLISADLNGKGNWLGPGIPLAHIPKAAEKFGKSPEAIVSRLVQLGFAIQLGVWRSELEFVVALWHGCSRADANRRLTEAGWTPAAEGASAPDALET